MRVPREVERLVKQGEALSADDAAALERGLEQRPDDVDARVRLLGYHKARSRERYAAATTEERLALGRTPLMGGPGSLHDSCAPHALWLAANAPRAPAAAHPLVHFHMTEPVYAELSAIWRGHAAADPPDATLLAHAIAFFWTANEIFADELLARAEQLLPGDQRWRAFRGNRRALELCMGPLPPLRDGQYAQGGDDDAGDRAQGERNLDEMEQLLRDDDVDPELAAKLRDVAGTLAFELGRVDHARAHAERMLVSNVGEPKRERSDDAHTGHLLLGRIALHDNDVERAKAHLILAGRAGATGLVQVFGPDMRLAHALLVRDERDVVIRYLTLCRAFWERAPVDEWIAQIRAGKRPGFGRNLKP